MKFIKVLGALMLLLVSGYSFSFSPDVFDRHESGVEHQIAENLEKGSNLTYDSNLSVHIYLHKIFPVTPFQNFSNFSSHQERIANEYFSFSKLIYPGLGLSKIIFPFHSFL